MSKRKSSVDSGMKASAVCRNKEDVILGEVIPDDTTAVVLFLPGNKEGECYLRETLKSTFTVEEPFPVRELVSGRMHTRVYKLPISGIWITGETAKLLICSTYVFFEGTQPRKIPMGSVDHMSSKIYNREETVYDFVPMFPDEGVEEKDCPIGEENSEQFKKRIEYEGGPEESRQEMYRLRRQQGINGQEIRIKEFLDQGFRNPRNNVKKFIVEHAKSPEIYSKFHTDTRVKLGQFPSVLNITPEIREKIQDKFYIVQDFLVREFGYSTKPIPPELQKKYKSLIQARKTQEEGMLYMMILSLLSREMPEIIERVGYVDFDTFYLFDNLNKSKKLFALEYLE